jgi:hypothetical protein
MRAKTINETTNFERGLDPKVAMDIGGISLEDIYIETVQKGFREWGKQLDSLKGKKVTFHIDLDKYMQKKRPTQRSFIITEVSYTRDGEVIFFNENDTQYFVDVTKKIYVG